MTKLSEMKVGQSTVQICYNGQYKITLFEQHQNLKAV